MDDVYNVTERISLIWSSVAEMPHPPAIHDGQPIRRNLKWAGQRQLISDTGAELRPSAR